MQDLNRKTPGARWPWVKILLGLSLALNLAFVSLIAGAVLRTGGGPGRVPGPGLAAFGAPYMLALPREDRRAVLRDLRRAPDGLPNREERRAKFQNVLAGLRATPFDIEALRLAVSEQAAVSVRVQQRAQDAWLNTVAAMSDKERLAYAARVEELLKRGPKRR